MADNFVTDPGSGGETFASDDIGGIQHQRVKIQYGTDGSATDVSDSNPLPIDDAGGSITVDGTVTSNAGTGPWPVTDNAGSLTIDNTTIDNAHSADYDTGAGTDTTSAYGIAIPANGGAVAVDSSNPLPVDASGNAVPVTDNGGSLTVDGTVTANLSATDNAVLDQIDSNTDYGAVTGGGVEASALRVTIANDSTGVISVDDNGSTISVDDGGGALTVDGTVTANLSATDNAVLDQIEVNTSYGDNTGGGTEAGALRVTLANDSTGVLSVDDNGGSLTVDGTVTANLSATDNTVLDNIDTNTSTIAGAVKSEDAAHTTGDDGIPALTVRNDSDTSLAGTDGDYTPLQVDSNGYLKVNIKAGAGSGGTASTDDAAFTAGSGSGTPMMGFATSDPVDSGDVGVLAMDTSRNLKVSIEADNAGIGGGTQYTEDDAAAANPVGNMSMAVRADTLSGVTSADGDNIALRATDNGELYVKQTDSVPVTDNGGSLTVDGTVTANLSATDNAVLDNIDSNTSSPTNHYRNIDANAEDAIKGSAGVLYWIHAMNLTSAVAYLHLYDATTANVTPGTTTPDFTFPLPTQGDTNGAGFTISFPNGQSFTNAITLVCTTTNDGSTGDPGTNGVMINAGYE